MRCQKIWLTLVKDTCAVDFKRTLKDGTLSVPTLIVRKDEIHCQSKSERVRRTHEKIPNKRISKRTKLMSSHQGLIEISVCESATLDK